MVYDRRYNLPIGSESSPSFLHSPRTKPHFKKSETWVFVKLMLIFFPFTPFALLSDVRKRLSQSAVDVN